MPIASTLFAIHWILLEHAVEHIRRIDLTAQIPIITRIITTNQMSKGGLAIAPIALHAKGFRAFETRDLGAEVVVQGGDLESFGFSVSLGSVDCHVEDAEVKLAEVEERIIDMLDADLLFDQVIGDLGTGKVVR